MPFGTQSRDQPWTAVRPAAGTVDVIRIGSQLSVGIDLRLSLSRQNAELSSSGGRSDALGEGDGLLAEVSGEATAW
jgi:hypothetical protein